MNPISIHRGFSPSRLSGLVGLILLMTSLPGVSAISEGPKLQNAVEEQQRRELLFDQAILSGQEKLRVGQQRYEQSQAVHAKMLLGMTAQLQARQQAIGLPSETTARSSAIDPSQWWKPVATVLLVVVVFICSRFLYISRKREQAAADREKLF